jgi:hypothetical protein
MVGGFLLEFASAFPTPLRPQPAGVNSQAALKCQMLWSRRLSEFRRDPLSPTTSVSSACALISYDLSLKLFVSQLSSNAQRSTMQSNVPAGLE